MIDEGTAAPDFELRSDDGSTVRLSDLRGKPVVLYFYPKDDTPLSIDNTRADRLSWSPLPDARLDEGRGAW
jgi:peroxiredoxin